MLKKLHVLAGALRSRTFTVAELAKACQLSESTVHTVLQRVPQDWFTSRVLSGGHRGGQPRQYQLTETGEAAIRESIGRLPSATPLAPVQVPSDAPPGLLAARAAMERLTAADASLGMNLRKEALDSLEWAEAELDDGGFSSVAGTLRSEIRALRLKLVEQPPRVEPAVRGPMDSGNPYAVPTYSLAGELAGALRRLAQLAHTGSWDQWAVQRVTPTQRKILELLGHGGETFSLSAVARELNVTAATAVDSVSALEAKGLVRKKRSTIDGRALALVLTDQGRTEATRLLTQADPLWGAFDALADSEQETLYRLSVKMIRGLQENGALPTSRMCLRCRFFEPFRYVDSATPHHCHYVDAPFAEKELRIDCPVFKPADANTQQSLWERFTAREPANRPTPSTSAGPERGHVRQLENHQPLWPPTDPEAAEHLRRQLDAAQVRIAELEEKLVQGTRI